ncbi:MAG: rhomboid family intramembrane serine protease, partial [Phycisphaerae bacterium]|nr:rhomboid family intramembrane serine protease [Phycisphaerae bacterium]
TTVAVSGAVSGIMGAYFIFYPSANLKVFVFYETMEVPAILFLGLWFLLQLVSPFLFKGSGFLNTAWPANVVGFIFGLAVAHSMKGRTQENEQG